MKLSALKGGAPGARSGEEWVAERNVFRGLNGGGISLIPRFLL